MAKSNSKDIVLIRAGVLSTTPGSMLRGIEPDWNIHVYERLDRPAIESSDERNSAGTGRAALCELNYTVLQSGGSVDIERAKVIDEEFEISKQFWGRLVKDGGVENPRESINPLSHINYARGRNNVKFLKDRYRVMKAFPMLDSIEYTKDIEVIKKWIPLMMKGHEDSPGIMTTDKINEGTDVNFGELTRKMVKSIEAHPNTTVQFNHEIVDFEQLSNGQWEVTVRDRLTGGKFRQATDYVFIGAGGETIPLLQKTGIPEGKHLGGFPINGQFLACTNPQVIGQHDAKVYSKEPPGTLPVTVPCLDTCYVDGQRTLLLGPFANVGPKFLKNGSNLDLFKSVKTYNVTALLAAAVKNLPLIKYLFDQVIMTKEGCMNHLRAFYPETRNEDWQLYTADKRVQVIKDASEHGRGFIQFGIEVVNSQDHTVIALLGESPGAPTSASVTLEVLGRNFPEYKTEWAPRAKEMIPSYGGSLIGDGKLTRKVRKQTSRDLELGCYEN